MLVSNAFRNNSNQTADGTATNFYASSQSGIVSWAVKVNDTSGDSRALVAANPNDAGSWTTRVASIGYPIDNVAPTLGTATTFTKDGNNVPETTATLIPTPESNKAYVLYRSGGANWNVYPITVSGTTNSWGSSESVHALNDNNEGRIPAYYLSATNGNWYLQITNPGFTLIKLTV